MDALSTKGSLLILLITLFASASIGQTTITSASSGDWSATSTWEGGVVPVDGENVIIKHEVSLDDYSGYTDGVNNVTITSADNPGENSSLSISDINTGDVDLFIQGTLKVTDPNTNGVVAITITSAEVTFGNSTDDAFIINAGTSSIENCTMNVAGYWSHNSGRITFIGPNILNISTAGVRNDGNRNFFIGPNATFKLPPNTFTVAVNMINGNTTAEEVYIEQTTPGYVNEFQINFNPVAGDNTLVLKSNMGFNTVSSSVGSGNTLHIEPIAADDFSPLQYQDIFVTSGSINIHQLANIDVTSNFDASGSDDNLTFDGYVQVQNKLTLNATNSPDRSIIGNGTVLANQYFVDGNTVFGIPTPTNNQKYSSATWVGAANGSWFTPANWSQNSIPSTNTSVIIKNGGTPVIGDGGTNVNAAVMEIESGATLAVNTGKTLDVVYYGILSGGTLNTSGNVNFGTNLDLQSGSSLTLLAGGSVKVGP